MSTILVEDRVCPLARPALAAVAETCRAMGHEVFRWRGPFSGRVGHWRHLFPCDLAVLFNGTHPRYEPALARLREMGAQTLFVEVGWHPQRGTCQIDPQGINAAASWASEPLDALGRTELVLRNSGDLLVVLQLDDDTQITHLSPWFPNMATFVDFICRNSPLPVRVRQHPKAPNDPAMQATVERLGATWDRSPTLTAALADCRAMACVNSSCGVEAMALGLPVLCYGGSIYRHPGAVYCLDDDPVTTESALREIALGHSTLYQERIAAVLDRIREHQWSHAEIPRRLPELIEGMLPRPTNAMNRRGASLQRFIRDLPATIRTLHRAG